MMIKKQDVSPHGVARLRPGNVRNATAAGADRAMPSPTIAHPAAVSKGPASLHCITTADRAYIARDLPKSVVRDVLNSTVDEGPASGIDWDGIAIGAFLAGFLVLAGAVFFKVAAFPSQSTW